jgi:RNA polymerase sigma-70 factor (ECF subfamily)
VQVFNLYIAPFLWYEAARDSNDHFRGTISFARMSKSIDDPKTAVRDEDYEIILSCQRGDDEAFGVLVERHQKKMLNMALRMTGDYDEACEIVQEAFLAAYRAIRKFRGEAKFSTWIYGIVVNISKTRMKQTAQRRQKTVSIDDPTDDPGDRLAGREASALETLEKKEIQAKVQHCINTLDEEYREVLVLRDIQGFSYDEIGDILNVPEGTVKSRLFRARDAMKNCLKKQLGEL